MPILGVIASSFRSGAADTGAMFPLQVVTVGAAGASSVEFTNIPTTGYAHLQIRGLARTTTASVGGGCVVQFNSDTTTGNYYGHGLYGDGASVFAYALDGNYYASISSLAGGNATASVFGSAVIDVLDYRSTNKYKTVRNLAGFDNNGSGQIRLASGLWMSTSAITSVKLVPTSGNFAQYSQFALYGVKGAA